MSEHQEFVELCAFYTSGSLSDDQLKRLNQHLEVCLDCRRALEEFQEIETMGLPALAPEFASEPPANDREPATDRTTQRLLARINNEILACQSVEAAGARQMSSPIPTGRKRLGSALEAFRYARALLPYAAAVLLTASVSLYSYHLGAKRVTRESEPKLRQVETRADSLQMEIARVSKDREALSAKLQESDRTITRLMAQVRLRLDEIATLKQQERELTAAAQGAAAKGAASESERGALSHRLADAQASLEAMQQHLNLAREERGRDRLRVDSLESRLEEFSTTLKERDETIQQQRDLLAYDRDIRDLIGARDLYVAEVTDVGRNGETKTPFGRVFFTKDKSLIFYAYDLDKQPGVHRASIFQAWGRRGNDFQQALPLGILYLDSSSNRRWVLKFDDPKALAKIDAVFVTVEPKGGSRKPSGKPLLFAYLKVEPNHP